MDFALYTTHLCKCCVFSCCAEKTEIYLNLVIGKLKMTLSNDYFTRYLGDSIS